MPRVSLKSWEIDDATNTAYVIRFPLDFSSSANHVDHSIRLTEVYLYNGSIPSKEYDF